MVYHWEMGCKMRKFNMKNHPLLHQVIEPGIAAAKTAQEIQNDLREYVYNGPWKDVIQDEHKESLIHGVRSIQVFAKEVGERSEQMEGDLDAVALAVNSDDPVAHAAAVKFETKRIDLESTFYRLHDDNMNYLRELASKVSRSPKDYQSVVSLAREERELLVALGKMTGYLDGDGVLSIGQRRMMESIVIGFIAALRASVFTKLAPKLYAPFMAELRKVFRDNDQTNRLRIPDATEEESRIMGDTEEKGSAARSG